MTETVAAIVKAHRAGTANPVDTVDRCFERIRAYADPALFISLRDRAKVIAEAKALAAEGHADRPLFGVPFAVKDNIDVKGMATTAACPAFAYKATQDATAVARLKSAGAIVIGKTNLDQFATGLVGVRSPYGIPRNPHDPKLIPGGSSSGSAVAVATGIVPLSLGTDTAGSGRVPAALNNIVGLKPSPGLVSTAGAVPACRSLDCISLFALTVDDAWTTLAAIAGPDGADPYSRSLPLGTPGALPPVTRIAVPRPRDRIFFDKRAKKSFDDALALVTSLGMSTVEIDLAPFREAARLLYEGPWLAERYVSVGEFIGKHARQVHPVTRKIVLAGKKAAAVDAFRAFHRLAELRAIVRTEFARVDALLVPTVPAAYTIADVKADPIALNTKLGTYCNFVNLLDLAGLAIPTTFAADGTPFGVTLLAPAGHDAMLATIGRHVHAASGLTLGALGQPQPNPVSPHAAPVANEIAIAVVGAHLSGMPLNGELKALGARFLRTASTEPDYRLFALAGGKLRKPGLLRVAKGSGAAIEVEVWALPVAAFGQFIAAVPPPLSIGTLQISDGQPVKGFLVESQAVTGARDISSFGGWRAFLAKEAI